MNQLESGGHVSHVIATVCRASSDAGVVDQQCGQRPHAFSPRPDQVERDFAEAGLPGGMGYGIELGLDPPQVSSDLRRVRIDRRQEGYGK